MLKLNHTNNVVIFVTICKKPFNDIYSDYLKHTLILTKKHVNTDKELFSTVFIMIAPSGQDNVAIFCDWRIFLVVNHGMKTP